MDSLQPILGRTLVFVAHPDDEAVGCGALLQRMRDPYVVFATDAAPRSGYFWKPYGTRESYAATRANEAKHALALIGVESAQFLLKENPIADQELFLNLNSAYHALCMLLKQEEPEAILTLAYEGGHPDHDACCFLGFVAGREFGLPVWEVPLYHREAGEIVRQKFIAGDSIRVTPAAEELKRKLAMFAAYESQKHVVSEFDPTFEIVRIMHAYDFRQPPHAGELNYEAWQWPMKGSGLCHAFSLFLAQLKRSECTVA